MVSAAFSGDLTGSRRSADRSGLFRRTDSQEAGEREFVWGVDPSTVRLAVSIAGPVPGERPRGGSLRVVDGRPIAQFVETLSFEKHEPKTGERLLSIFCETAHMADRLARDYPPTHVYVEQPFAFGHNVEPELFYACGVIQAGMATVAPVTTLAPNTWKMHAMGQGRGRASKPEIMAWARRNGYEGTLQDEADAWGIAAAGVKLLEPQPEQLALA